MTTTVRPILPALLLALASCVVNTDDLEPKSDAECAALGQKACGPRCVRVDDPATGCGEAHCTPCGGDPTQPNTVPACGSGMECALACAAGFADCYASPGCETRIDGYDENNCGWCGRQCPSGACDLGACVPMQVTSTGGALPRGIVYAWGGLYYANDEGALCDGFNGADFVRPSSTMGPMRWLAAGTPGVVWATGSLNGFSVSSQTPDGWAPMMWKIDLVTPAATPFMAFEPPQGETPWTTYIDGFVLLPNGLILGSSSVSTDLWLLDPAVTPFGAYTSLPIGATAGPPKDVVALDDPATRWVFGYADDRGTLAWLEWDLDWYLTTMATSTGTPSRLAVYSGPYHTRTLFWASEDDGSVHAMDLTALAPEVVLVSPPTGATTVMDIVADDDGVYWSNHDRGTVQYWDAYWDGVYDLGVSAAPFGIAVTPGEVYWTDDSDRRVYVVPK